MKGAFSATYLVCASAFLLFARPAAGACAGCMRACMWQAAVPHACSLHANCLGTVTATPKSHPCPCACSTLVSGSTHSATRLALTHPILHATRVAGSPLFAQSTHSATRGPSSGGPLPLCRSSTPPARTPSPCWVPTWCCGGTGAGSGARSGTRARTGWRHSARWGWLVGGARKRKLKTRA